MPGRPRPFGCSALPWQRESPCRPVGGRLASAGREERGAEARPWAALACARGALCYVMVITWQEPFWQEGPGASVVVRPLGGHSGSTSSSWARWT